MSQTVPCIETYTCNHSIRHSAKPIERNISKNDPISFEIGKSSISANRRKNISDRKTLSFSHTLFLWFWAFQGNKQCTCSHDKQSASLYIRQDSIDMLYAITAICCNQKLMHFSPSAWTSVLRRLEKHSRTVQAEYMHAH